MTGSARKVCLLGDFAVGKTSLVARFVHQAYSDKYLTTVGVKIDTKEVVFAPERRLKLVIWDIAGTDAFAALERSYLRGTAGYVLVSDGTRPQTLEVAGRLRSELETQLGALPFVFVINKRDLTSQWLVGDEQLSALHEAGCTVMMASAKTGENVEAAFSLLAAQLALRGSEA